MEDTAIVELYWSRDEAARTRLAKKRPRLLKFAAAAAVFAVVAGLGAGG